jgi:hypothetical protein
MPVTDPTDLLRQLICVRKLSSQTKLTGADTMERNAGMLRVPLHRSCGRAGYRL